MKLIIYRANGAPVELLDTQDPVLYDLVIDGLFALTSMINYPARPSGPEFPASEMHFSRAVIDLLRPLVNDQEAADLGVLDFLRNRVEELQRLRAYYSAFDPSI